MKVLSYLLLIISFFTTNNVVAQAPQLKWAVGIDSLSAASSISVDADTNIWITSRERFFPTVPAHKKFSAQGVALPSGGPGVTIKLHDGAIDAAGNFYTYGRANGPANDGCTVNPSGGSMAILAKHDSTGACQWRYQFAREGTNPNGKIAVDGNWIFAGGSVGTVALGQTDFSPASPNVDTLITSYGGYLAKYNTADFSLEWLQAVGGKAGYVRGLTAADGYVYATGYFMGMGYFGNAATLDSVFAGNKAKFYLAKYAQSTGDLEWVMTTTGTDFASGDGIAIGGNNVYVVGQFRDSVNFDPSGAAYLESLEWSANNTLHSDDLFVACYDKATGNYKWANALGSSETDLGNAIAIDDHENVYVTGIMQGTAFFSNSTDTFSIKGPSDIILARYDSTGAYLWAGTIGGPQTDHGWALAHHHGTLYVAGGFSGRVDFDVTADSIYTAAKYPNNAFLAAYATDSIATGLTEVATYPVEVFPNPTSGKLTVKTENCVACTWTMYDLVGKEQVRVSLENNATEILLPNLADGLYIWTLTNREGALIKTDKVIVGH